ncbi:MAG: flagellar motor protein MotA [Sulfuricurvum sp. PC08-66]|nr:MAG: flagellar motor protein MotA [Sulfuricurvum sp. PC08-66]
MQAFIHQMHPVSLGAISLLLIYFIAITWVFFYRYLLLHSWIKRESDSLQALLTGEKSVSVFSYLYNFLRTNSVSAQLLSLSEISATKESTRMLAFVSLVASTSPFIGLFGTVVSLLDTFARMAENSTGTMGVVTMGVSDALVATAVGIFVATFAYTFHQILKRNAYELVELIRMQSQALLTKKASSDAVG